MNERPSLGLIAGCYLKISLSSFGGGLSAWTQQVVVEERHWLDDQEFLSLLALCRILPGPNMVNFAVYLGSRLRGIPGVAAALGGLLFVPFLLVVMLGILYFSYQQTVQLQSMVTAIAAAAAGMTIGLGIKMLLRHTIRLQPALIMLVTFLLIGVFRWPLLPVLIVMIPLNVVVSRGNRHG